MIFILKKRTDSGFASTFFHFVVRFCLDILIYFFLHILNELVTSCNIITLAVAVAVAATGRRMVLVIL